MTTVTSCAYKIPLKNTRSCLYLGTCQKLSGGEGRWKQREGHNFLRLRKGRGQEKWAVKRGRVMQICARDQVHPQKKKEVLYFVKKKTWEK